MLAQPEVESWLVAALLALPTGLLIALGSAHGATRGVSPVDGSLDSIVFAARALNPTDGRWYANFGYHSHDPNRKAYAEGTKLYRLALRTRELRTSLADPRGGVRDPQVSYDGKKVLFS